MKLFLTFLSLLFAGNVFSQQMDNQAGRENLNNLNNGGMYFTSPKKSKLRGNVYKDDKFSSATFKLENGEFTDTVQAKFDVYHDEVYYVNKKDSLWALKDKITNVIFIEKNEFYKCQNDKTGKMSYFRYFKGADEGKYTLLVSYKKTIEKAVASYGYGYDDTADELSSTRSEYFLYTDGKYFQIKLDAQSVAEVLGLNASAVKVKAKELGLKIKNEEDLQKLINLLAKK